MSSSYAGKTSEALVSIMKALQHNKGLAKERMKTARTTAGKLLIEDLKSEIEETRLRYRTINTTRHTSIIVAELCRLQGKEGGLIIQLEKWTEAENIYKRFDKDITICQKEITVRNQYEQNGRV